MLGGRHHLERELDSEVTACSHDPVAHAADVVDALECLRPLDLGDDLRGRPENATHLFDIARSLHERHRNHLDVLALGDLEVGAILVGEHAAFHLGVGQVDALVLAQFAAAHDSHRDALVVAGALDMLDHRLDAPVVKQQTLAGGKARLRAAPRSREAEQVEREI